MQVLEHFKKPSKPKADQITIGLRALNGSPCVTIRFNKASMMRLFKAEIEVDKVEALVKVGGDALSDDNISLQLVKAGEKEGAIPFEVWGRGVVCLNIKAWFKANEKVLRAETLTVLE